jgi:hypothetical protein
MSNNWISSYQIDLNKNLKFDDVIQQPAGTKQVIAEVYYLNHNFLSQKDCLIYEIPLKKKPGTLSLVKLATTNEKCQSQLFSKPLYMMKDVFNLGVELTTNLLKMSINSNVVKIKLLNKNQKGSFKLGDHFAANDNIPGLKVSLAFDDTGSTLLADGVICHDIDDSCNIKLDLNCDLCQNSSYTVKASQCERELRTVCGQQKCGIKGAPACLRGAKASGYTGNYCISDSPIGICYKGLRVFCENGSLICN